MAWWIEMGHFCYPSAAHITYLYPDAIKEAARLGAPTDNVSIIPNGMTVKDFDSGITNWRLDVLGPTDHTPSYYELCKAKIEELEVEQYFTFRGTVNVRAMLGDFDLLVLPSYNEGQPIVVLEAMTVGVPTVGTSVGGMSQLIGDPLTTEAGVTWNSCGVLVSPDNLIEGMADALQTVLADLDSYEQLTRNARGRVEHFFQLHDAMRQYNTLYRRLGGLQPMTEHVDLATQNPLPDRSIEWQPSPHPPDHDADERAANQT